MYALTDKDVFSRKGSPIFVLDYERNTTIQTMIKNANSKNNDSHIALELADIKSILNAEGFTSSISNISVGKDAHLKVISPFVKFYKNNQTLKALLVCFTIHKDYSVMALKKVIDECENILISNVEIIFSILINNELKNDEVQMNMIIKY